MTSISKNVYIDKLNIVNKYINTYRAVKMKSQFIKTIKGGI